MTSRGEKGGRGERALKVRVKTAKKRSLSSTLWLERQLNDPYVARAKREGRNRVRRFEPEASPSLSQQRIEGATSAADDTHSDRSEHSKDASLVPR